MTKRMRFTALLLAIMMVIALHGGVMAQDAAEIPAEQPQVQEAPATTQELPAEQEQTIDQTTVQIPVVQSEQPSVWAQEGVSWSAIYGLVSPNMLADYRADVNRAELYAAACNLYIRATGKAIEPVGTSPFTDADLPGVKAACAIGILEGEGSFEPEKAATRKEMTEVMYKALEVSELDLKLDSAESSAADAVQYFVSNGLLKGRGGNNLYLEESCSRQELMVFMHRVYEFTAYETGNYSKGLFWKASDEDSTIYLLGSIHIADQSLYPLSKDIMNAFESSDTLVLEADLSKLQEDMIYMQQKIFYEGDETLDQNIPKELYDRFVELVSPLGLQPEMYNKFKPWYAAMLAQNLMISNTGDAGSGTEDGTGGNAGDAAGDGAVSAYSANLGIDMYFTSKAINNKAITEIEGLKFQVDMFDSFSNEIQTWYLESTLGPAESTDDTGASDTGSTSEDASDAGADDTDTTGTSAVDTSSQAVSAFEVMLSAWENGDAKLIEDMVKSTYTDDPKAVEFNTTFWNTRNNNMYERAKAFLADPENTTYFIVVGAGHMEGDTGIVTQLIENGYNVERILN